MLKEPRKESEEKVRVTSGVRQQTGEAKLWSSEEGAIKRAPLLLLVKGTCNVFCKHGQLHQSSMDKHIRSEMKMKMTGIPFRTV
jgi:hypothetical protein